MENVIIHARVLHVNVVGQTAFIQVVLRGVEFKDKKVPTDFPTRTLTVQTYFLVHFGSEMAIHEEDIVQMIPDKFIDLNASLLDDGDLTIHEITATTSSTDLDLAKRLCYLKQMH